MPARGTIQCHTCGRFKPMADFFARGVALVMCTSCTVASVDPLLAVRIRQRYGITAVEYAAMLLDQHNLCAVCEKLRPLHVDHCHITGKVRGLVCRPCNTGMGMFNDDADRLLAAAEYITYHKDMMD
ncbi:hypothetical protein ACVLB3_000214 [Pseudarthrobacter sp. PvP022]